MFDRPLLNVLVRTILPEWTIKQMTYA